MLEYILFFVLGVVAGEVLESGLKSTEKQYAIDIAHLNDVIERNREMHESNMLRYVKRSKIDAEEKEHLNKINKDLLKSCYELEKKLNLIKKENKKPLIFN